MISDVTAKHTATQRIRCNYVKFLPNTTIKNLKSTTFIFEARQKKEILKCNDETLSQRSHRILGSFTGVFLIPKRWSLKELNWVSRAFLSTEYDGLSIFS